MEVKKYSVVILLKPYHSGVKVLLQKKDRTAFAGRLNGIGGKIKDGEQPVQGALREMEEETTLKKEDLERFEWLGTLTIPEQCDTENEDKYPELWFFGGIVKDDVIAQKADDATEEIDWYEFFYQEGIMTTEKIAGDGDLEYFIKVALRMFFPVTYK